MSMDRIVKCFICGEPYVFMPFLATNQDACPKCRERAYRNTFGDQVPAPTSTGIVEKYKDCFASEYFRERNEQWRKYYRPDSGQRESR